MSTSKALDSPPGATPFFQDPPQLPDLHPRLRPVCRELGERAAGRLLQLARQAEAAPPRHRPYDAWGRRVDEVQVSPAWKELHREAARWGLTAVPYERELGGFARLHQFALLELYGPSSAIYTCPLAMTDGAARTLLEHDPALAALVVPRLTSRDPDRLWTSGQWMTERAGGSDVGGTETSAERGADGRWRLRGTKWFTSAVTSEMALTLARPAGGAPGSAGLSLFYLELREPGGGSNGIRVLRLKDKLGTRALPTAELSLEDTLALPVGGLGGGVKKIAPLLNITRLHNAISACGMMARLLQLLRDYARRRVVFGQLLAEKPLHWEALAELQVEYEAALALTLDAARLLGRQEAGEATEEDGATLRLLTPLAKLLTAKQAVALASEALEGFGGAGYVEDTGLPGFLRDAQVLAIWEGTTNVLSLDVLRACDREGVFDSWLASSKRRLEALRNTALSGAAASLAGHVSAIEAYLPLMRGAGTGFTESVARRLALQLAGISAGLPLLEQGAWGLRLERGDRSALAAHRWVESRIPRLPSPDGAVERLAASRRLSGL